MKKFMMIALVFGATAVKAELQKPPYKYLKKCVLEAKQAPKGARTWKEAFAKEAFASCFIRSASPIDSLVSAQLLESAKKSYKTAQASKDPEIERGAKANLVITRNRIGYVLDKDCYLFLEGSKEDGTGWKMCDGRVSEVKAVCKGRRRARGSIGKYKNLDGRECYIHSLDA